MPKYKHECPSCAYLGEFVDRDTIYDLYACLQGGTSPTLIARYSSGPADYMSGIYGLDAIAPLREAAKRCISWTVAHWADATDRRKVDRRKDNWNEQLLNIHRTIERMNLAVLEHYRRQR